MARIMAIVLMLVVVCAMTQVAYCEQSAPDSTSHGDVSGSPAQTGPDYKTIFKALSAALAIGFSAMATAWAQSKIGAAAAGAIAEKPEVSGSMIILEALPETIIILGFVIALLIIVLIK
jgi:V/A-type H+-transporting ATPase subunit K